MKRTFLTIDDVLRHNWQFPKTTSHQTDRLLRSTRLEDAIYTDLRQDDASMDAVEAAATTQLPSFPALSRDVFQSFYALAPKRNDEAVLSCAARKFHAHLLDHVMQQDDFPTLKSICEGRELPAYDAAAEFLSRTASQLDSLLADLGGDKGALHTLEKLEQAQQEAAATFSALMEQYLSSATGRELLELKLLAAANQLASKLRQQEAVSKNVDVVLAQRKQQTRSAVSVALEAATEKARETQNILAAWGKTPGNASRCPENLELLQAVRQSPQLLEISRHLGRFREILAQGKKNGYAYGRGETYSLELGNDISRAITSELAMLASPATLPLFLRKYQTRQLKQYRRRTPVHKGMGDIICCLDESGSTRGPLAALAKAIAMALLEVAAESHRKFALIHFASREQLQLDLFLPGHYSLEDRLRAAETFLDGGTDFEAPMTAAMALLQEQSFQSADIVFITDGECSVSESFLEELHQEQAAHHFTVTGILLDRGQIGMDFSLKEFCQKIYRTSELLVEDIVRDLMHNYEG